MNSPDQSMTEKTTRIGRFGVSTALAAVLLAGCAANPAPRADVSAAEAAQALAMGERSEAIVHAEAAVAADPYSGAFRTLLGNAYLDAGRFASAEMAYSEAMELGENSPRVALSLALSLSAQAKYYEANALLNAWEGMIAPADIGLAYTLAGQPQRGIHIMTNAIRAGENTVKMRQNLAYAYAADGRWRDARVMVSQDVPAGEVGARMAEWASMAQAEAYQHRIASLLQVPVAPHDPGRPVHLALANNPTPDQLAAQAVEEAPVELAALEAPAPQPVRAATAPVMAELPPVSEPAPRYASLAEAPAPKTSAERQAAAEQREAFDAEFAAAFAPTDPVRETLASVTTDTVRYISDPVVQNVPATKRSASAAPRPVVANSSNSSDGTHLVQLGSFLSERAAIRAWDVYQSRYPELAAHQMVITEAVVNGRRYFRVSAAGYDRSASRAMCNRVNRNGGDGCISWAAAQPLPGAIDTGVRLARR